MNTFHRVLASLCLVVFSVTAQAETLRVSINAGFDVPPLATGPGTFSMSFELPEPLAGVVPQGDEAFALGNVPIIGIFNGAPFTSAVNSVAWFNYADPTYRGIDIRMSNMFVAGDQLQMIVSTTDALYTGPADAPTLERLHIEDLGGFLCYYATGSGACTAEGPMFSTVYDVSAIPEPASLWLFPVGLGLLATWRRRHQARAMA